MTDLCIRSLPITDDQIKRFQIFIGEQNTVAGQSVEEFVDKAVARIRALDIENEELRKRCEKQADMIRTIDPLYR